MSHAVLERGFERMGARLRVLETSQRSFTVDVRDGVFELALGSESEAEPLVVDVRPEMRHLLLLVRDGSAKHKFLCGHDERHWFAAAVPNDPGVHSVPGAMEALKPALVRREQDARQLKSRQRIRRRNEVYVRQGEWFFLPVPDMTDPPELLHNEPLSRGNGSKPHIAEFCYRSGGHRVYVCRQFPGGLREAEYQALLKRRPFSDRWRWEVRAANAEVYVRGTVRHPDHKTIRLKCWHRVRMNRENEAPSRSQLVFLD